MATKTTKAVKAAAPVTGLGETIEQITELSEKLGTALLDLCGKQAQKKGQEILAAAYQFGLAERRRKHLARKLGRNGGEDE